MIGIIALLGFIGWILFLVWVFWNEYGGLDWWLLQSHYKDPDVRFIAKFGAIGFGGITVLASLLVILFSEQPSTNQENVELRSELDYCLAASRYEEACKEDPVYSYCALTESNILGSGCTSRIRSAGTYSDQVAMCKREVRSEIVQVCLTEIYGCSAVTGQLNC